MNKKPSKKALGMIGREISYELDGRRAEGTVIEVRRSNSTIVHAETLKESPGVQFLLRPDDGGKEFWTTTFPDKAK